MINIIWQINYILCIISIWNMIQYKLYTYLDNIYIYIYIYIYLLEKNIYLQIVYMNMIWVT